MKRWYESKIVWVSIIQTAIGILALLAEYLRAGDYSPVALTLLVSGVLTCILRIWFTDMAIG